LNNPLRYVDPTGNEWYDIFYNPFYLMRAQNELFTWVNDKLNGDTRPNGYFNDSYLIGRTEPGGYHNYNPSGQIPYGHPLYTPPFAFARASIKTNADNSTTPDFWDFKWYWAGGTIEKMKHLRSGKEVGMVMAWGKWYVKQEKVEGVEIEMPASNLINEEIVGGAGFAGTIYGGALSMTVSEMRAACDLFKGIGIMRVAGGALGGVGAGLAGINVGYKIIKGTHNTADYVDLGASAVLLITGLMLTNPIGIGLVVGVGMAYSIYRLAAGEQADILINNKFGFRP
jgi:hypothetical protein